MKISLVIATYNWPEALVLCLKSVERQTVLPSEIIVADDGSGGLTKEIIEKYTTMLPCPILHIWHEDVGFRKTLILNKAIKASNTEYIIEIDGDVILNKHFVYDHLQSAEKNTFIRGTRAMLTSAKTQEVLKTQSIKLSPFSRGVTNWNNALRCSLLKWLGTKKRMSSRSVRGSNISYFKDDFIKVNGYNNNLTGWGHEDEELAARFINNGIIKKIVKLAAVQYHLYHPASTKENESSHASEVDYVVLNKIKTCEVGYNSI